MKFASAIDRDANRLAISGLSYSARKTMTLAGGTTNDPGDYNGTGNPATLFTVTGDVLLTIFAVCNTDLAGASATISVGATGNTAAIIPVTTATDIDDGDVWVDTVPGVGVQALPSASIFAVNDGADIIQTVATADITAGVIEYYCLWRPLSSDGKVVAA